MPRARIPLKEQLAKLEQKTNELLMQRQDELMNIFQACNAITVDDSLLAGFLIFVSNTENKDNPILKTFSTLAKANKVLSKLKKPSFPRTKRLS